MPIDIDPAVEAYAEAHTTPPTAALADLAEETVRDFQYHGMMVGPLEGRFLEMLVFALQPRLVVEIGTFTGYSSISMAAALPPGGRVVTCDVDETSNKVARRYADAAGVADRIEHRLGPALDTIASLDGPFDLVFIDADKTNYVNYYEAVLPKLADGGLIAADNTLWSGRVVESADDENTLAIRAFNDRVAADERVVCAQLTLRDGVTLIRKRPI
jgi:caffeoyl-CoA O-methyltransferase